VKVIRHQAVFLNPALPMPGRIAGILDQVRPRMAIQRLASVDGRRAASTARVSGAREAFYFGRLS
jgi:hypothetical protein